MVQEACHDFVDDVDSVEDDDGVQSARFSCSIPTVTGRGFIEVPCSFIDS